MDFEVITFDGHEFWERFMEFYNTKPHLVKNKHHIHDEEGQKANAELGLQFIAVYTEISERYFRFKIIDKQRWMLTKIKYGI